MEDYLGGNLVGKMESLKIIVEINNDDPKDDGFN